MEVSDLVYDRRGSGTPLLLLHGLGHRRQAWEGVMPRLAERHDVVAVDLPGFGESPRVRPEEPYDLPSLVDLLVRFCAALELRRPHVAGNSLGGALALELGGRGVARSVTALSPIGFAASHEAATKRLMVRCMGVASRVPESLRRAATDSPPGRALARRVLRGDPRSSHHSDPRFDPAVLASGSAFVRLAPEVVRYVFDIPRVPCQVTVGWGDRDRVLPARAARRVLGRIPHAQQVTLLGCGHIPMADNPSVVAALILATCASAEGGVESVLGAAESTALAGLDAAVG